MQLGCTENFSKFQISNANFEVVFSTGSFYDGVYF